MDNQAPPIKFSNAFTDQVYKYIDECKAQNKTPTLKEFSKILKTDVHSLWAWALKKEKDEKGNLTENLSRPKFHAALTQLETLQNKEKEEKLNPKQELFCKLYATNREFFGNGVQTYMEVYELDQSKPNWYRTAQVSASQLLSNPIICKRINELLSDEGLNDSFVDKQLLFVIAQHDDKSSKVAAIREYNKLKKRITDKLDVTTGGKPIKAILGGEAHVPENNSNQ